MRTKVALFLLILIITGGLLAKPASTQTSPTVPEFTLKIEDDSHNIVNASGTFHLEIKFVDVIIKSTTPYTMYSVVNDTIVKLYYNVHIKGHSQDWANAAISGNLAPQENVTVVKFGLGSTNPDPGGWSIWLGSLTNESKVDFQVRGVNGFYTQLAEPSLPRCWRNPSFSMFNETGRSAWSDTQTITLPTGSTSEPAPSNSAGTFSITNLFFPIGIVVAAAIIAVLATALIYLTKHGKSNHQDEESNR